MSLSHLLLGLLDEPATGYDLKKVFDQTLRHFWAAELSQIYPALQRLERDGYLASKAAPSSKGPARRVYRRTAAGRRMLRTWLERSPEFGTRRFPYLGQLCCMAELNDLDRTRAFLLELRAEFTRLLETYRRVEDVWFKPQPGYPDDMASDFFHAHLTVRAGIVRMEANVAWCDECLTRLEARDRG